MSLPTPPGRNDVTPENPERPLLRYKLTVGYDGTDFYGWQKQEPEGGEPMRTAQGVLEEAIARTLAQPIVSLGASRTDSGVHAIGQSVSFTARSPIPIERLPQAINSRLPDDLCVYDATTVPEDFDVIRDVTDKQYRYRVWAHPPQVRPLAQRHAVYHSFFKLDPQAMELAASKLVGTYDFACLANAQHGRENTVRTIHDCRVESHPNAASGGGEIHVVVSGSGFLYHMVRIIAGTLVEVGRGRFEPDHIDTLLAKNDRALAGPTLPPQGLCLEWVKYKTLNPEP